MKKQSKSWQTLFLLTFLSLLGMLACIYSGFLILTDTCNTLHITLFAVGMIMIITVHVCMFCVHKRSEREAMEKANQMKTDILLAVSHELKTPLSVMSGYAQNAERNLGNCEDTALIQEQLKCIRSEANRMAFTVTQILDASRIEEGQFHLDTDAIDIDAITRSTIETYFAVLNKNNNRIAVRIPLDLPKVFADPTRLQRVLVCLIANALKYTHNGIIIIRAVEENGFIKVTVQDSGCGISPEELPHIWERYYNGNDSQTGTRLGLFVCKNIIELHGGTIYAESEIGKGTSFVFTLPCMQFKNMGMVS